MIDVGCKYYVGDEDCHKCAIKGLLFHCDGCKERDDKPHLKNIRLEKHDFYVGECSYCGGKAVVGYYCMWCGKNMRGEQNESCN